MTSFTLWGFKQPREVVNLSLGKLEREVMNIAWPRDTVSVREVFQIFAGRIAYTTLMTTLHRLYKKGVLSRRKSGRAFLYSPRVSPQEFEQGIAKDLIAGLMDQAANGVEPLLACIVDAVGEHDRLFLDALDRLIRQKKKELQRRP